MAKLKNIPGEFFMRKITKIRKNTYIHKPLDRQYMVRRKTKLLRKPLWFSIPHNVPETFRILSQRTAWQIIRRDTSGRHGRSVNDFLTYLRPFNAIFCLCLQFRCFYTGNFSLIPLFMWFRKYNYILVDISIFFKYIHTLKKL